CIAGSDTRRMDYSNLMKSIKRCVTCRGLLHGRQRRFCSRQCKNADTNNRHQSYACQQARGMKRKLQLMIESGGCCSRCGYRRNIAALAWHHVVPSTKRFNLDVRNLSNRSEEDIRKEL